MNLISRIAVLAGTLLVGTVALTSACAAPVAAVPAVVCVGEATTYLDWLEGTFQPEDPAPITQTEAAPGDLLSQVRSSGTLRVSTDSDYAPQSFQNPDGSWAGFDIDVATEIANRLGVEPEFSHQDWDIITAGSWANRWDMSVGSMTVTAPRKQVLAFTQAYYYTPAALAASKASGVTATSQLPFELPEGAESTTLRVDGDCAEAIRAGRTEFSLWISARPTIDEAIAKGIELNVVADPIFVENLSVSMDRSGPGYEALLYEVDRIIGEMHGDGKLTEISQKWYDGEDLTKLPSS